MYSHNTPSLRAALEAGSMSEAARAALEKVAANRYFWPPETAQMWGYWIATFGGNPSTRLINHLVVADIRHKDDVTWAVIKRLESMPNFGTNSGDLLASLVGLAPRANRKLERTEKIELALRDMVRHAEALIKGGTWRPFSELDRAKQALKR